MRRSVALGCQTLMRGSRRSVRNRASLRHALVRRADGRRFRGSAVLRVSKVLRVRNGNVVWGVVWDVVWGDNHCVWKASAEGSTSFVEGLGEFVEGLACFVEACGSVSVRTVSHLSLYLILTTESFHKNHINIYKRYARADFCVASPT